MRRRTIVLALKIALPLAALGVFASLFLFNDARFSNGISFDGVDVSAFDEGLKLQNPSFTGATNRGEPFTVSAAWALPDKPRPERVEMGDVTGEITLVTGETVYLAAKAGVLLPKANTLTLEDRVQFERSGGYTVAADAARFDADAETMTATGNVVAMGPFGRITADRMRISRLPSNDPDASDAGDVRKDAYIWFENRVKVFIDAPNAAAEK